MLLENSCLPSSNESALYDELNTIGDEEFGVVIFAVKRDPLFGECVDGEEGDDDPPR